LLSSSSGASSGSGELELLLILPEALLFLIKDNEEGRKWREGRVKTEGKCLEKAMLASKEYCNLSYKPA